MAERKFTDEEVIKALEFCVSNKYTCDGCPCVEGKFECVTNEPKFALDLINRQRAEIGRLHNILLSFTNEVHTWSTKYGYDTTGLSLIPILNEAESVRETIKVEAIKEFAEKLKEELTTGAAVMRVSTLDIIDCLVKEMTEGKQ